MIVEDEIIIAIDLKIRLENLGYNVLGISVNGRDAIKKTGEKSPDLVLMDILLKGEIDGIEAAKRIRKLYDIPFIYLTGSDDDSLIERSKQTDPSGYISKPFNDTEIQNTIEMANGSH